MNISKKNKNYDTVFLGDTDKNSSCFDDKNFHNNDKKFLMNMKLGSEFFFHRLV